MTQKVSSRKTIYFDFYTSYLRPLRDPAGLAVKIPKEVKVGLYPESSDTWEDSVLPIDLACYYDSIPCKRNLMHIKIEELLPFSMSPPHKNQYSCPSLNFSLLSIS